MAGPYLDTLFRPRSVAVFGASERPDSVGFRLFSNLLEGGFRNPVHPINPRHEKILGQRCYKSLSEVDGAVDLALIATPAPTVPGILRECGEQNVRAAIVFSAGFGDGDDQGRRLSQSLLTEAGNQGIRLLGPNCLGLMRPSLNLNATFSNNVALPGGLALVSQSGALCTAIVDWASAHRIGFSVVASIGSAYDLDFGDILDYLALDQETRSILLYVEGIRDARRFMSGLRAAARLKPVIVIKAGRYAEGSRAAVSHTGALVGADDVFDAALKRAGVVRAKTIEQLFAAAQLLASAHPVQGDRLAIVTNAGGPGVMATDAAVERGLRLAELSEATLQRLDQVLPAFWSHGNPVDIIGDATPERYAAAVEVCLADPGTDGLLVMLTPQAMTDPTGAAKRTIEAIGDSKKPVLACWLGETQVKEGRALFTDHGIPSFPNPESATQAFGFLAEHHRNQQMLLQVPGPLAELEPPDIPGAHLIMEGALGDKRSLLSPLETRAILGAFRIPMLPALPAHSPNEALAAAECLGFPVALKVLSPDITHKSDVDGVMLNVTHAESVRQAYNELLARVGRRKPDARIEGVSVEKMYTGRHGRELLVGVIDDPVFGPVIGFGAGGTAVEISRDRAIGLPPVNAHIARTLIGQTRISAALGAFRNLPPIHMEALVQTLQRVSEMVCELPQIREMDINPLMADETGVYALDARIVVRHPPAGRRRYDHMAIHPYPAQWVSRFQLNDGTTVTTRPIRPEDAAMVQAFVRGLSEEAKYFRFMQSVQELSPEMLVRLTQLDYHRELALIATVETDQGETEVAVARFFSNPGGATAEFAIVVADAWQRRGIGSRLMAMLSDAAREKGIQKLQGEVLADNGKMLHFVETLGFSATPSAEDASIVQVFRNL
ncbi:MULTISPECIES: bifunctional acetate--CoA ligase family protein/GNAT family N-acetyltransferase [Methylococcus]|uniref:bifunctional acetate--CoA ligase family protein/GNAT family N-acetyltransferase n=1 Tax=Methylococcus TaxID=413 RepID=UPI001C52D7F2|nr:GNAT family N-acetyltransferase [Methylococcus capsulatus]QXP91648.1 GNAT family N-acetyltransferase [Methylococcus capsulatus]